VALPPSAGSPRATQRADAHGAGVVALALLLGRPLALSEYPDQLAALVEGLSEFRDGQASPLSASFKGWLQRALQFDVRTGFQSPSEAQLAFESVLASDRSYVTSSAKLDEWVTKVGGLIDANRRPAEAEPLPADAIPAAVVPEPLVADSAGEETLTASGADHTSIAPLRTSKQSMMALGGIIVLLLAVVTWLWSRDPGVPRAGEGELVVQSRPVGARVSVDGTERGLTPLTVRLPSGAHVLEVQIGKAEPRVIPLTIQANVQTAQYVELQGPTVTGSLELRSDPSGARVTVDGQPRGTTPATIRDLSAGDHVVIVEAGSRKVSKTVKIEAGTTAQLVIPIPRR
ncbi:MAG: PEGA domain-containing protein, partial [Vicinamibacterales bacterium]